jgi:hypothetical protein
MATNNNDITLRFILDQAAQQRVEKGVSTLAEELEKVGVAADDIKNAKFGETVASETQKVTESVKEKLNPALKSTKEQIKQIVVEARVLRAEAASIASGFEKARIARIRSAADRIGGVSRAGLAIGGAVVGGIVAEANRFAKEAEGAGKATAATREWTRATEELAAARSKVDQVLLREALPLLQQAAKVASEAASFIEKNPEIVQAALKVGVVVAGLGAIGVAVSKGIRLYADVQALLLGTQELAAAKLQDLAADKQLIAARLRAGGLDIPGGAKVAGVAAAGGATTVAATVAAVLGGVVVGAAINDALAKAGVKGFTRTNQFLTVGARNFGQNVASPVAQKFLGMSPEEAQRKTLVFTALIGRLTGAIDENSPLWERAAKSIKRSSEIVEQSVQGLTGSENEAAVVSAFTKWREDDARLIQEAADNRRKVIESTERSIAEATRKYGQQRVEINRQADKARADLIRDFAEDSKKDEIDYANARADIVRDSGEDIRKIEQDHQEQIRRMTIQHDDRTAELTASRDALGLVKEQRRFDRERTEAERETNQEIAQRRRDIAIRLQELAAEFAQERTQRQTEFQQNIDKNEARRQEQLKQAAAAHAEEMNQLRAQRSERLREIQEGLNAERLRRREVFLAEVRDLDAGLLGERDLKNRHYAQILRDAEALFAAFRSRLPTTTRTATSPAGNYPGYTPSRDEGGYMGKGLHRVAWNGIPEFAMSGRTTRAAEQIIGGRLTQDALLNALANGGRQGGRNININLTDSRQFDRMPSSWEREQMNQEMIKTLEGLFS